MKRLLAIALTLSVASCDTSATTADGTSSETQTALQALADNVRREPEPPGGAGAGASSPAARKLSDDGDINCDGRAEQWTRYGRLQAEQYDGNTWWANDSSKAWMSIRNELATDASGGPLADACPTGYMQALAEHRWRTLSGVLVEYHGRFWRDSGSTGMTNVVWNGTHRYPSGFMLKGRLSKWTDSEVVLEPAETDWEYSFGKDGRFAFRFRQSREEELRNRRGSDSADTSACVPVEDRWRGGAAIGSVCMNYRTGLWTIRDASGAILLPQASTGAAVDDSLGVRVLSALWDGDSLRIALRVQTAPFDLRQWSHTSVLIGDSLRREEWLVADMNHPGALFDSASLPDTNFVGPRRVDFVLHRAVLKGATSLQVDLMRKYKSVDVSPLRIGGWWVRIPAPE